MSAFSIGPMSIFPIVAERRGWVLVHWPWQFALIALLAIGAADGSPPDEKPQREGSETAARDGEIIGRLINAATGKPIEGATIACLAVAFQSGNGGGQTAVTDADGRYSLPIPSGIYIVWLQSFDKNPSLTAAADEILVEASQVATSELRLVAGRKIAGRVLDSNGKPSPNLRMKYYSAAGNGPQDLRTNDDGTFEFAAPPGRVQIFAFGPSVKTKENPSGTGHIAKAHFNVSPANEVAPLTLKLKEPDRTFDPSGWLATSTPGTEIVRHEGDQDVTGTIVDKAGQPIPGAKVFLYRGPMIVANDKGEFRFATEKNKIINLHAFAPGYHLWFGTPRSGDVLKIVLEQR